MLTDNTPALELGKLLRDYRGKDVTVLDLRDMGSWTDFFVIATVTSGVHLQGLERHVKAFSKEKGIETRVSARPKAQYSGDEWLIIDLGTIVVHLMSEKARAFYELERLWSAGAVIFKEHPEAVE